MAKQMDMDMVGGGGGSYSSTRGSQYPAHLSDKVKQMIGSSNPEIRNLGMVLKQEEDTVHNVHIKIVQKMMIVHPELIIGGSTALFLHGIRLKRWRNAMSDIDMITPYYVKFEDNVLNELVFTEQVERIYQSRKSHFTKIIMVNKDIKMDLRIDPKQQYEYVEYEEFKYKVSTLEIIMKAKCKYAIDGSIKHKEDIKEICQPPMAIGSADDDNIPSTTTSTSTVTPKYRYQQTS